MKKQIKNIIFVMLLVVVAGMTFSCTGLTDSLLPDETSGTGTPDKVQYNGKKPSEAINYVGNVNKIYLPASTGRFTNGQILKKYMNGLDAKYESKLVEYDSLTDEIKSYLETETRSTDARHETSYQGVKCKPSMKYVEFASFTDIKNGTIMKYDLTFFDESVDNLATKARRIAFSPDMTMDIERCKYIATKQRAPKYKYPYSDIN